MLSSVLKACPNLFHRYGHHEQESILQLGTDLTSSVNWTDTYVLDLIMSTPIPSQCTNADLAGIYQVF